MGKLWNLINTEYVYEKDKIEKKVGHFCAYAEVNSRVKYLLG